MASKKKRKRVLFVTPPGYGHLFPLIPLAWAFRCAAHDVLIATCGVSVSASTRAGLPTLNVAQGVDLPAIYARHRSSFATSVASDMNGDPSSPGTSSVFTDLCDAMVDGVVRAALDWRADLIVFTPDAVAALIASTVVGLPAVFLGVGMFYTPAMLFDTLYQSSRPTFQRWQVSRLAPPAAWIDATPPSLRSASSDGLQMRTIQYSGGSLVDLVKRDARQKPRVAVTFGTIIPLLYGLTPVRGVVAAARDVNATFVIAHGASNAAELEPLPPNVQASSWIALDALLESSDAVVHHGGSGTTLAVLAAGLPQLIIPYGADQFGNAEVARRRGVACVRSASELTAECLELVLGSEQLRAAASEVRAEMADMPSPTDVVPTLLSLTQ